MMESYVTRVCRYIRCIQSAFSSAIIKIAKIVFQHENAHFLGPSLLK